MSDEMTLGLINVAFYIFAAAFGMGATAWVLHLLGAGWWNKR